jgi:Dolichyl-phosphate-mannose-protein mannosyltransferase
MIRKKDTGQCARFYQLVTRTASAIRQQTGKRRYVQFVLLFFLVTHLYRISDPPNGFHKWRETDTVAIAYNFYTENWNFLKPRIDMRGAGDGVVGMELPVYNYTTALFFALLSYSHLWPRLLTVAGACLFLLGLHRLCQFTTGSVELAGLAIFLAATSPLFFFYSRKILPDVWALALGIHGFAFFVAWVLEARRRHVILSSLCVALAAAVKPSAFCMGLPMLGLLLEQHNFSFLRQWRYWFYGMACVLPAGIWFHYALHVNPATRGYFYLGGDWGEIVAALQGKDFYQHALLTFPWELIIGLPMTWAFLYALWKRRFFPRFYVFLLWIVGCYAVFALLASHIATSHDYYMLPAVAPMAVVTAYGIHLALAHRRPTLNLLAIVTLVLAPILTYGRIAQRYDKPYDLFVDRALADAYIPTHTKVVTYERTPCVLLYRTGRKGWHIDRATGIHRFLEAVHGGAEFFIAENHENYDLAPFSPYLGPPLYTHDGITVYPIVMLPQSR